MFSKDCSTGRMEDGLDEAQYERLFAYVSILSASLSSPNEWNQIFKFFFCFNLYAPVMIRILFNRK